MNIQGNPNFKTDSVQVNGLAFSWIELGSGLLVLALHGFPDLPRTFRYQMQALAQAGYRVVAPYMRGYFPTDAPPTVSYERAALTQDTLGLIDVLSDQPIILIGHDWGAAAAYGAALLAPEKIAKLITIAVPYGETWWNALITNPAQQRRSWYIYFFQMPFAETAVAHDDFAFLERLWQDWSPGWAYPPEDLQAVKDTFRKPGVLTAALNYYRHSFNSAQSDPALKAIRERHGEPIAVPTLYVHGARDGGIGVETTVGMEGWFQNGLQKWIIAEAGHFVHQEQPDIVNRLILEFIQPELKTAVSERA
ncbi:MAG TPA: alpha/beta hydrolase [Anaerolineales bacterium]|nr:alpha/beta hydrolase [Anaerolineales bacterium]